MKEAFEKIKDGLKEIYADYKQEENIGFVEMCIDVVNQVAEEYSSSEKPNLSENLTSSNDGWIPCEIETPEFKIYSTTRLWVTMHRKGCGYYFVRTLRWNGYQGRWEWDNGKQVSDAYEVVAWRQIDALTPYQPKGE